MTSSSVATIICECGEIHNAKVADPFAAESIISCLNEAHSRLKHVGDAVRTVGLVELSRRLDCIERYIVEARRHAQKAEDESDQANHEEGTCGRCGKACSNQEMAMEGMCKSCQRERRGGSPIELATWPQCVGDNAHPSKETVVKCVDCGKTGRFEEFDENPFCRDCREKGKLRALASGAGNLTMVRKYLELSSRHHLAIAKELGIEIDPSWSDEAIDKEVFRVAKEGGLLTKLWDEIEKRSVPEKNNHECQTR